jgi:flagellar biosynthetic protein FliQ
MGVKSGGRMSADLVIGLMAEAVKVTLLLAAPMLVVGLIVGLIVSIFQAVTQIQEMTLTFVPKIVGVMVALIVALPWMLI